MENIRYIAHSYMYLIFLQMNTHLKDIYLKFSELDKLGGLRCVVNDGFLFHHGQKFFLFELNTTGASLLQQHLL